MGLDWKYPKLSNYKEGMSNEVYLVQEKLDGCNIQLEFTPNGKMVVYSRSCVLNTEEKLANLFGLGSFLEDNEDTAELVRFMKDKAVTDKKYYRLAGEYFGNAIQKRIDYDKNMNGDTKGFKIFDIFIEGCLLPPIAYLKVVEGWNLSKYVVSQQIMTASSVDDAVRKWSYSYDLEKLLSWHSSKHYVEGVVFKSSREIIKHKRASFGELTIRTKKEQKKLDIGENCDILNLINENRVLSAQSKLGLFQPKDFSTWLNHIVDDCVADYDKEIINEKDVLRAIGRETSKLLKQMYM